MDTAQPDPSQLQEPTQATFGALLRRYRLAARLSQETLAERARMSVQGLSALENGKRRAPYRHTVGLLAQALGLSAAETAALEAAVPRGRLPAGGTPLTTAAPVASEREVGTAPAAPAQDIAAAAARPPEAAALPTGTLTFLLTDVEGSTPYWEHYPAAIQASIGRHDALMEEVLTRHGGRQVKERGEGDSILAVFTSPSAALAAVCALQQALLAEPWPAETPLRVRVGLHTGEAELRGIGYYGVTVNRTARIRSLAHGGQVLLSQATADLVRGALPAGVSLRPLGAHRLKGLAQPEEIYQVVHPGLPAEFPPLASPAAHPSNLPVALSSFIGREREQAAVRALLGAGRLVTLTGAGGAGKTRLAVAVAGALLDEYPDGVWLVELAPLADRALVAQAVAQALGLREEPGRPFLATLTDHLKERRLLLVLDNCEHLVGACAELATALLQACPQLHVLATTREGLGVAGERLYRVPSLAAPPLDDLPPPEGLGEYAAVALFVARAQERPADFALTAHNARAVAAVCARLDGLPLAIELAAARVGSLPLEAIAARLDDRFRLLTTGPRTALPRQQTLRAALDWSYDLLSEREQRLLDRLAVFAGGWTLAAAEAVCGGEGVETWEVLDLLGGLVNKSLVLLEEGRPDEERGRYRLLETVRQYGWERLTASEEAAQVRDGHLAYFLALAEEAEPRLTGPEQGTWLARLEAEHDNLRAALGWAREREAGEEGLRLAGALWRFWAMRGYFGEGRGWLEAALAGGGPASTTSRATALSGNGVLAFLQGDRGRAVALQEEGLALFRELGDKRGIAASLNNLGMLARRQGNYGSAAALYEEGLRLSRELGDAWGVANSLHVLGDVASDRGEYGRAVALHEESLRLSRELGDRWSIAHALQDLGGVAFQQGDYERVVALCEESLALRRALGDKWGIASSLHILGKVAYMQGNYGRAAALCEEGLALRRELGDKRGILGSVHNLGLLAYLQGDYGRAEALLKESLLLGRDIGARDLVATGLECLAWVAGAQAQPLRATRLGGAAEALREALGTPLPPEQRAGHDQAVQAMRAALGEEAFAATWAEGRALPLDAATGLALEAEASTADLTTVIQDGGKMMEEHYVQ